MTASASSLGPRDKPEGADDGDATIAVSQVGPSHHQQPPPIHRLQTRAQFLAAARGASVSRGAVVVQMLDRQDDQPLIGEGFTATKKIGGAVVRNRAKRRLREAARALLPRHGVPGRDYVFIARAGAVERAWSSLLDDVGSALIGLAAGRDEPRPARRPKAASKRASPRRSHTPGPASSDG